MLRADVSPPERRSACAADPQLTADSEHSPSDCDDDEEQGDWGERRPARRYLPLRPRVLDRRAAVLSASFACASALAAGGVSAWGRARREAAERSRSSRPSALFSAELIPNNNPKELPGKGCANFANVVAAKPSQVPTKSHCAQRCMDFAGCVAYNYQQDFCENEEGFGSGSCLLYTDLCDVEENSCWEMVQFTQITQTLPWQKLLPLHGCKNWKEAHISRSIVWNADMCGQLCHNQRDCVNFNYQSGGCDGSEQLEKGACYLFRDFCQPEPNSCWDVYTMQANTATEVVLTQVAASGSLELSVNSIRGLKVNNRLQLGSEVSKIVSFFPLTIDKPFQHPLAVGTRLKVQPPTISAKVSTGIPKGTTMIYVTLPGAQVADDVKICSPVQKDCEQHTISALSQARRLAASAATTTQPSTAPGNSITLDEPTQVDHPANSTITLIPALPPTTTRTDTTTMSPTRTMSASQTQTTVAGGTQTQTTVAGGTQTTSLTASTTGSVTETTTPGPGGGTQTTSATQTQSMTMTDTKTGTTAAAVSVLDLTETPTTTTLQAAGAVAADSAMYVANDVDADQVQSGPITYQLVAGNTGKRWCRGPGGPQGSSAMGGEGGYTSGEYQHVADVKSLQECADQCTAQPWCLGIAYKHSGSEQDPDFQEGSCQLVSKLEFTQTGIQDLDSYTKGIWKKTPSTACMDSMSRESCSSKAQVFGQKAEDSPSGSTDSPAGCFRNTNNGKFYFSQTGTGLCTNENQCLCE